MARAIWPLGAQHLELGEDPGAADAYRAAAEAAAADYRSELALDLASRGLALAAPAATRVALANLSGELLQGLGRTEEAVAAFRAASKDAAPGRPRLRAWLGLAQGLSVLDRLDEASALLAEAEAEAKAEDVAADGMAVELSRLHTLRANVHFPRGEIERCLAEHSEALRLAEAAGAGEEQARALGGLADAYYMRGLYRTTEQMFRRCVDLSAAQGFKRIEAANLSMLAIMMFFELRFSEALAAADRGVALADQIGHRRAAMIAHHARFFLCFDTGELAEARRSVDAALEIAEALQARRFIAEGLFFRALLEQAAGDARARDTLEDRQCDRARASLLYAATGAGAAGHDDSRCAEANRRSGRRRGADRRRRRQPQHPAVQSLRDRGLPRGQGLVGRRTLRGRPAGGHGGRAAADDRFHRCARSRAGRGRAWPWRRR